MATRSLRFDDPDYTAKTGFRDSTSASIGFEQNSSAPFDGREFSVVIELHGGLALEPAQASLTCRLVQACTPHLV